MLLLLLLLSPRLLQLLLAAAAQRHRQVVLLVVAEGPLLMLLLDAAVGDVAVCAVPAHSRGRVWAIAAGDGGGEGDVGENVLFSSSPPSKPPQPPPPPSLFSSSVRITTASIVGLPSSIAHGRASLFFLFFTDDNQRFFSLFLFFLELSQGR